MKYIFSSDLAEIRYVIVLGNVKKEYQKSAKSLHFLNNFRFFLVKRMSARQIFHQLIFS